jgi:5-(carboxyamino)imidazole ribonucleotide mutase
METKPLISVIMGSRTDFTTLEKTCMLLDEFGVAYETLVVSAHRTPERMFEFAKNAKSRGIKVVIAGAGGAAHLPGMVASLTTLPVIGVPVKSKSLNGLDSLLSIVQMPAGVPVATVAIGEAGAKNAAILAVSILAIEDKNLSKAMEDFKSRQKASVPIYPEEEKNN